MYMARRSRGKKSESLLVDIQILFPPDSKS